MNCPVVVTLIRAFRRRRTCTDAMARTHRQGTKKPPAILRLIPGYPLEVFILAIHIIFFSAAIGTQHIRLTILASVG